MPLSPEQIKQLRGEAGLSPTLPGTVAATPDSILAKRKAAIGWTDAPETESKLGSVLNSANQNSQRIRDGLAEPVNNILTEEQNIKNTDPNTIKGLGSTVASRLKQGSEAINIATAPIVAPIAEVGKSLYNKLPQTEETGIPGEVTKEKISNTGKAILDANPFNTEIGGKVHKIISDIIDAHPDLVKSADSLFNIISQGMGAGEAVANAPKVLEKAKNLVTTTAKEAGNAAKSNATASAFKKTLELTRPELNKAEREAAIAAGRGETKGVLGNTTLKPTEYDIEVAKNAQPYLKPKASIVENVNNLKTEISKEAESLKTKIKAVDKPINPKDFTKRISSIEKPVLLSSDTTLDNAYNQVVKKASDFVNKSSKTTSGLLDARKEFDRFIEKQFPNLYNDQKLTPMKSAIKDIRREFNNYIEENLPDDVGFRDSLRKQNLLYEAVDNMSTKGAKELGGNKFVRFSKKHPVVTGAGGALLGDRIIKKVGEMTGL